MSRVRPLAPDDPPGLGRYLLTGRLGEGGQGVVYLGTDASGEPVAIKLLQSHRGADPLARSRFVQELAAAKKVARFCTAEVIEADVAGHHPYLVSEYVPGPSLHEHVGSHGPLGGGTLDRLAVGIATALAAIHRAGIVHRDLNPHNVILGPDGPRVIDFGIAKALDAAGSAGRAESGTAMGTPAYMAPEQISGGELGPATDLFAWAATTVFAATGSPPFGDDSIPAVLNRILYQEPSLDMLGDQLRPLVVACLAKAPGARPSAQQLLISLLGHEATVAETVRITGDHGILRQGRTRAAARVPLKPGPHASPMTTVDDVARPPRNTTTTQPLPSRRRDRALKIAALAGIPLAFVSAAIAIVLATGGADHSAAPASSVQSGSASTPKVTTPPATALAGSYTLAPSGGSYEPDTSPREHAVLELMTRRLRGRAVTLEEVSGGLKFRDFFAGYTFGPDGTGGFRGDGHGSQEPLQADQALSADEIRLQADEIRDGQAKSIQITVKIIRRADGRLLDTLTLKATRQGESVR